ncbi:NUDIX hydrolase [Desulfovibrio sp. OttesenSCG-928-A18]|nr:NUDIX hydrolase [Desulfovibrio sp. OttesenSCG-928-A18]
MPRSDHCPHCGKELQGPRNPLPTVDIIIACAGRGLVLVKRRFAPLGWALPGGFVDYGESVEAAAKREAFEETNLSLTDLQLFGVYSDPKRDPRRHTISTVFTAMALEPDQLRGGDDAAEARFFQLSGLPDNLAFDHAGIVRDFSRRSAKSFGI